MAKFPFVIYVEQLLALLLRLPVWRLSPDHDDVGAMAYAVFRRAAGAAEASNGRSPTGLRSSKARLATGSTGPALPGPSS